MGLQPCPQHFHPPHPSTALLHKSSLCFFLHLLTWIQMSPHFSPNSCHSCLNMFEWWWHVLLWLDICSLWTGPICFKAPAGGCAWPKAVQGLHRSPPQPLTETFPVLPSQYNSFSQTLPAVFPNLLLISLCPSLAVHCWLLSLDYLRIFLVKNTTLKQLVVVSYELHTGKM